MKTSLRKKKYSIVYLVKKKVEIHINELFFQHIVNLSFSYIKIAKT